MTCFPREWVPAAAIFALPFAAFLGSMAPDLTWGDSGELVADVHTLGIPHPTGYPLYVLAGRVLSLLPVGNPAYRMNLLSGLCAALTALVLFRTALLFMADKPADEEPATGGERSGNDSHVRRDRFDSAAAAVAAFSLAFTPLFWFQATKAEVYAPASLLGILLLFAAARCGAEAGTRWASVWALVLGAVLVHHRLLLILLPLALWLVARSLRQHHGVSLWRMGVLFLAGLSPILYLWLRGKSGPVLNWGGVDSLRDVVWVWRGGFYGESLANPIPAMLDPDAGLPGRFYRFFAPWFAFGFSQFGWGTLFAALGLTAWLRRDIRFGLFYLVTLALALVGPACYLVADKYDFFYLFPLLLALPLAEGIRIAIRTVAERLPGVAGRAVAALFFAMPLWLAASGWSDSDRSEGSGATRYAEEVLDAAEGAVMIVTGIDRNELSRDNEIHALWHGKYVRRAGKGPVILGANFVGYEWYNTSLRREGMQPPDWEPAVRAGQAVRESDEVVRFVSRDHWVAALSREILLPALARGTVYATGRSPGPWQGIAFREVERVALDPGRLHPFERPFLPSGSIYRLVPSGASPPAGE